MLDYIRIACAVPLVKVADVRHNAQEICRYITLADQRNADLVVFPELALTGYTCADLFFQDALYDAVKEGIREIASCTGEHRFVTCAVGLPVRIGGKTYNCAAVFAHGELLGIVPKTHLPNANEFSEKRWFSPGSELRNIWLTPEELGLASSEDFWSIPVSNRMLFDVGEGTMMGIEICQDLWVPTPPSSALCADGAEVILNLSASNETVGKRSYRRDLVKHQSAACSCVYAYCSAGSGESTQDLVFSGHSLIAERGVVLAENRNIIDNDYMLVMDCDLGHLRADRRKAQEFSRRDDILTRSAYGDCLRSDGSLYPLRRTVFVPEDPRERERRCGEIFAMQTAALKHRIAAVGCNAVVGVSGGLDSTLALLVAVEAMRQLGRPASDVHGVTMPCFGTSDRTYRNAWELMKALGVTAKEINIRDAVTLYLQNIGHDITVHNTTYENAQARERTQVLMDYAGMVGGIVVGTGDLSELALGWCTYNADHMSMYGVNAGVPKTLIPWIIRTAAEIEAFAPVRQILQDILDTPISPELLPPDENGNITQHTEDLVGPYELHDFFLYYMLRCDFAPRKIYTLACRAFAGAYDEATVKKWLQVFYRRFFAQQYKRSCMPDGVKVGSIGLSPRGDWKMPSDASGRIWLEEMEKL